MIVEKSLIFSFFRLCVLFSELSFGQRVYPLAFTAAFGWEKVVLRAETFSALWDFSEILKNNFQKWIFVFPVGEKV